MASLYNGYVSNITGLKGFALNVKNKRRNTLRLGRKFNQIISNENEIRLVHSKREEKREKPDLYELENISKRKNFFKKFSEIFQYKITTFVIFILVFANIIIILMDKYVPNRNRKEYIFFFNVTEIIFVIIFSLEIFLRILIFRKKFFISFFNVIDFAIILANIIILIHDLSLFSSRIFEVISLEISLIRAFKFLRLFRFIIETEIFKNASGLFLEMMNALKNTSDFFIFILMSILMLSLMGMELFSYKVRVEHGTEDVIAKDFKNGIAPRNHYDTFSSSYLTTTLIFLNEEWHIIMFQFMRVNGSESSIYVVIVLAFGSILLTKMFMALYINQFLTSRTMKSFIESESVWHQVKRELTKKTRNSLLLVIGKKVFLTFNFK